MVAFHERQLLDGLKYVLEANYRVLFTSCMDHCLSLLQPPFEFLIYFVFSAHGTIAKTFLKWDVKIHPLAMI